MATTAHTSPTHGHGSTHSHNPHHFQHQDNSPGHMPGVIIRTVSKFRKDAMSMANEGLANSDEANVAVIDNVMKLHVPTLQELDGADRAELADISRTMKLPALFEGLSFGALGWSMGGSATWSFVYATTGFLLAKMGITAQERNFANAVMSEEFNNRPDVKLLDNHFIKPDGSEASMAEKIATRWKVFPKMRIALAAAMMLASATNGLISLKKSDIDDALRDKVKTEEIATNPEFKQAVDDEQAAKTLLDQIKAQPVPSGAAAKNRYEEALEDRQEAYDDAHLAVTEREDEKIASKGYFERANTYWQEIAGKNKLQSGMALGIAGALQLLGFGRVWRGRKSRHNYNVKIANKKEKTRLEGQKETLKLEKEKANLKVTEILQDAQHCLALAYAETATDDAAPLKQMMDDMARMSIDTDRRVNWAEDLAHLEHQLSELKHQYHKDEDVKEHLKKVTEHLNTLRNTRLTADADIEQHRARARVDHADHLTQRTKASNTHDTQRHVDGLQLAAAQRLMDDISEIQQRQVTTHEEVQKQVIASQRAMAEAYATQFDPARYNTFDFSGDSISQILGYITDHTVNTEARQAIDALGAINSADALNQRLALYIDALRNRLSLPPNP